MKKILLSFSSLVLAISMAACSSNVVPSSASISVNANMSAKVTKSGDFTVIQKPNGEINYIADAGNGKKTNASITVKISPESFTTKSSDGVVAKVGTDVLGMRFWLLEHSKTGPAPVGSIHGPGAAGGDSKKVFDFDINLSVARTVTFTNVPDNSGPSKGYYIAVAAYSVVAATPFAASNNIVNIPANTAAGSLMFGPERAMVTSGGGDTSGGGGAIAGEVQVVLSKITPAAATGDLTLTLKLSNAIGANVTGKVTAAPGDDCTSTATCSDGLAGIGTGVI